MTEAATPYQLMKIDVSFDSKSLLLVKDVKLPTATKAMLKQITPTPGQKETFLKEYRSFILAILQKMQGTMPTYVAFGSVCFIIEPSQHGKSGKGMYC